MRESSQITYSAKCFFKSKTFFLDEHYSFEGVWQLPVYVYITVYIVKTIFQISWVVQYDETTCQFVAKAFSRKETSSKKVVFATNNDIIANYVLP